MLSTLRSWRSWILADIGAAYLLLGLFSLYNSYIQWKLGGPAVGQFLMYGLLYVPLAYLFFTRSRWLLWLVALNLVANIGVWGYRSIQAHSLGWVPVVIVGINALVAWLVWREHASHDTLLGRIAAGVALFFWFFVLLTAIHTL